MGFPAHDAGMQRGLGWFVDKQQEDGASQLGCQSSARHHARTKGSTAHLSLVGERALVRVVAETRVT